MEDILASIRRIIAEDQSNNLGRGGLGGLTRRQQAMPPLAAEDGPETASVADTLEASGAQASAESELHAGHQADMLHHASEMPAPAAHAPEPEVPAAEPVATSDAEPVYGGEPAYHAHEHAGLDAEPEAPLPMAEDLEPLMSPTVGASITSSFQTLAESVMLQDPDLIERVLRESMRPLLKTWLDDHLPSIVERLVRLEIERVARGGRARNA